MKRILFNYYYIEIHSDMKGKYWINASDKDEHKKEISKKLAQLIIKELGEIK